MSAREVLDGIKARIADCSTYNFGMRNANKLAYEDAPRLTGAVDAVLGLHVPNAGHNPDCHCGIPPGSGARCCGCYLDYPCPTVAAIENAIKEQS